MAEDRKIYSLKDDKLGEVKIADEVVAIIAGLAATEVEGVSSMAGNITNELVSKLGMKNLSKGVKVEVAENVVSVYLALNIAYGVGIPEVSATVQERVKTAVETMTGLEVAKVDIRIVNVEMEKRK
ncbi:MAG: Asp23/Gls24 family envelope stress response protein [Lachnospiraceae bacterium]